MTDTETSISRLTLTAQIVAAQVKANTVPAEKLPSLIRSVYMALTDPSPQNDSVTKKPVPAVDPKRSVFKDYIVCLEDGKKLKMLKRHLMATYNMSPADYRQKWGLPANYPMVAPNYAQRRSELAQASGLGSKITTKPAAKATVAKMPEPELELAAAPPSPELPPAKKKRTASRPRKTS